MRLERNQAIFHQSLSAPLFFCNDVIEKSSTAKVERVQRDATIIHEATDLPVLNEVVLAECQFKRDSQVKVINVPMQHTVDGWTPTVFKSNIVAWRYLYPEEQFIADEVESGENDMFLFE
jgi:hypothetical protein